ncbi:acetylornithine deacetylase [Paenibacillus sp. BK033]|uniref:M20 family metallopeptidase n=1 Tax=Paenibacillus sp. BK033 TaxID=2512133 RepID=UPI00104E93E1|nr:M20/M25/M40 family metallo-hydrolase [Paenibacillus sp. BK033]TCM98730.1 acetylornithine deacetylase [Paenibacillus sp. BK033]
MERDRLSQAIRLWVEEHREEAVGLAAKLVQIPSVNHPPDGDEAEYQRFLADWLQEAGAEVDMYQLMDVPGLKVHPAYMDSRVYTNRPNVAGSFFGGTGRSLLFSGHADTVYQGTERWNYPPFGGEVHDGYLYGRGAYDMKGGMAAAMMAVKCLISLNVPLAGAVHIESVVDEEHGGANGSLAGRLRGLNADMAIIPEPSNMRLYTAHLGGGIWKARFEGKSGIGFSGEELVSALDATVEFAAMLKAFREYRLGRLTPHPLWKGGREPEVTLLSIYSGDASRELQEKLPATGELNFWIEAYPGVTGEDILAELWDYYEAQLVHYPTLVKCRPQIKPLIRYLSGSEMRRDDSTDSFLQIAARTGQAVLGVPIGPPQGSPFACDGFMFNLYSSTPALILGPSGENAHAADECLELDSYERLIRWYAEILIDWCGLLP